MKWGKQMKKGIIFIIGSMVLIFLVILWWALLSPVKSGLYVQNKTGSYVIPIKEDSTFEIPVVWVKKYPWEKVPNISSVRLVRETGEEVAQIEGEFPLLDKLDKDQNSFMKRVVETNIELDFLALRKIEKFGYARIPFDSNNDETITLKFIEVIVDNRSYHFPLEKTVKIFTLDSAPSAEGIEGLKFLLNENDQTSGYVIHLNTAPYKILESFYFWLPGMNKDYMTTKVQYAENYDMNSNSFSGERLELPFTINSNHLYLYFPITKEIRENIKNSIVHLEPWFTFTTSKGKSIVSGGILAEGPFQHLNTSEWKDRLIPPVR